MLSGKFEKSWSIKERVADILADSRNKGTFDSKSRKKENTWTEIAFARRRNIFLLRSFDILWGSPVLT